MNGYARIERFLDDYVVEFEQRALIASERALLQGALITYICHEQWMEQEPTAASLVDRLLGLSDDTALAPNVAAALVDTARSLEVLSAKLARREHANHIMREELANLSELLRQARQINSMEGSP